MLLAPLLPLVLALKVSLAIHCSGRLQRVAPGSGESGGREPLTTGAGGRDLLGRFSLSTWSPSASLSRLDCDTHFRFSIAG